MRSALSSIYDNIIHEAEPKTILYTFTYKSFSLIFEKLHKACWEYLSDLNNRRKHIRTENVFLIDQLT